MTFKQTIRRLFADLWYLCAKVAADKISTYGCDIAKATDWEKFIIRCEQRALRHAEHVPKEEIKP